MSLLDTFVSTAVRAGASFLDQYYPDWFTPNCSSPIDLSTFRMQSFTHCVLGQVCIPAAVRAQFSQDYTHLGAESWMQYVVAQFPNLHPKNLDRSFWTWAAEHGFYPPIPSQLLAHADDTNTPYDDCRYRTIEKSWDKLAQEAWTAEITHRRNQP